MAAPRNLQNIARWHWTVSRALYCVDLLIRNQELRRGLVTKSHLVDYRRMRIQCILRACGILSRSNPTSFQAATGKSIHWMGSLRKAIRFFACKCSTVDFIDLYTISPILNWAGDLIMFLWNSVVALVCRKGIATCTCILSFTGFELAPRTKCNMGVNCPWLFYKTSSLEVVDYFIMRSCIGLFIQFLMYLLLIYLYSWAGELSIINAQFDTLAQCGSSRIDFGPSGILAGAFY